MPIDYKEYPANWKRISERIRFERAKNHCEQCGAENYQPHPVTGSKVILTVAHKDHIKERCDGLELNAEAPLLPEPESNLAAWCQRCHLAHDMHHHVHNRKYGRETRKRNCDLFAGTEHAYR